MKKKIVLFLSLLLAIQLTGCGIHVYQVKEQEFSYENMHITLTNQFEEQTVPNMAVAYFSPKAGVLVQHLAGQTGLKEYTAYLYENLRTLEPVEMLTDGQDVTERGGYFRYKAAEENGTVSVYSTYTYETAEGLWSIQFVCAESQYERLSENIAKWEATIRFDET